MKKLLLISAVLLAMAPATSHAQAGAASLRPGETPKPAENSFSGRQLTSRVISSEGNTYGYEIFVDGKAYIRQLNMPGAQGNKGFVSKKQAEAAAALVLGKMRNNVMPPTISAAELNRITTTVK